MKTLTILELEYKEDSSLYFDRFVDLPYACFLDSSAFDGEKAVYRDQFSRYDIITAAPCKQFTLNADGTLTIADTLNQLTQTVSATAPLSELATHFQQLTPVDDQGLPFTGGIVGFWGYELCEQLEDRVAHRALRNGPPHMSAGLYHWGLITNHKTQQTLLVLHPDIDPALQETLLARIDQYSPSHNTPFKLLAEFTPTQSYADYQKAFQAIQNYILAGDCYEVNLTQRFSAPFQGDSWTAFKHLRTISKAPYSAYLAHPDFAILSHSPEHFISLQDGRIATNPIKGTRPRGSSPEEDAAIARELQHCHKDRAENLMIVDLLRNDLGKVCKTGSVKVPRLFALESYANVHHLVSTVHGELADGLNAFDLLSSSFPGGSITGAPKIRAMEIIRELEPVARTVYCGSIGYISSNGNMDTSITIRTILAKDGELHCWGGGAIVADSDCEDEYQESITKVSNLMTALQRQFLAPGLKQ